MNLWRGQELPLFLAHSHLNMAESLFCDVICVLLTCQLKSLFKSRWFSSFCYRAAFSVIMVQCCAYSCSNRSVNQSGNKRKYFFHRFPKDKSLRKQWLHASGRDGSTFSLEHAVICSHHFSSRQYQSDLKFRMGFTSKIPLLEMAVPDQNIPRISSQWSQVQFEGKFASKFSCISFNF